MSNTTPEPKKFSQLPSVNALANTDILIVVANGVNSTVTFGTLVQLIIDAGA